MEDAALLLRAADFAATAHRAQRRKNGDIPYVNHPLAVARILAEEAGVTDGATLAVAILHDTLEDTATTRGDLEREFGPAVAAVVAELTDDHSLPKVERKRQQVARARHLSAKARLVALADKLHNLRDLAARPPRDWEPWRVRGYFCWAREVVAAMGEIDARLRQALDEVLAAVVPKDDAERRALLEHYYERLR